MTRVAQTNMSENAQASEMEQTSVPLMQVDRKSLVNEVCLQIRSGILARHLGSSGVLPSEGDLAQRLGVSRTVIREAMQILQAQGLVEKAQGRPARLKEADTKAVSQSLEIMLFCAKGSLMHLMEVRRALESEIVLLAVERATADHIAALYAAIEQQRHAPSLEDSVRADVLFHQRLAEATGNPLFGLLLESVSGVPHETVWRTLPKSGPQPAIDGHIKITEAIRRRDQAAARQAMLEHMQVAEHELENAE